MNIGHFYFLKPSYFNNFPNSLFMDNHNTIEFQPHNRPCFCAFTEDSIIYWLIPITSKLTKFEKIYNEKMERYGKCDTIDFCNILGHKKAVLIQNMCPVTKEFILNEYCDSYENPIRINDKSRKRIIHKAKKILALQRSGYNLIFGDVLAVNDKLSK